MECEFVISEHKVLWKGRCLRSMIERARDPLLDTEVAEVIWEGSQQGEWLRGMTRDGMA
jgi:hypothetical protein